MNMTAALPLLLLCAVLGLIAAWAFIERGRERARADEAAGRLTDVTAQLATVTERARALEENAASLPDYLKAQTALTANAVAEELLKRNAESMRNQELLSQAKLEAQLKPVAETLTKFETKVEAIEKARAEEAGGLKEQLSALLEASAATQTEARKLSDALKRSPNVRGRWGEQTLRNVLEACGLVGRFDFAEQVSVQGEEGRLLRPDVIVRLAGGGALVLDSKVNYNAYLDALEAGTDAERADHTARFVRAFRQHVDDLTKKAYWDQFKKPPYEISPAFVVMFVPGENFLCAALDAMPQIIEEARQSRVIIASPSSLFALLQAVALGWRAEDQAQNAREIAALGRELYARIATMSGHLQDLGTHLGRAVGKYNSFLGSYKDRVVPQARKFEALAADHETKDIPDLTEVDLPRGIEPGLIMGSLVAPSGDGTSLTPHGTDPN